MHVTSGYNTDGRLDTSFVAEYSFLGGTLQHPFTCVLNSVFFSMLSWQKTEEGKAKAKARPRIGTPRDWNQLQVSEHKLRDRPRIDPPARDAATGAAQHPPSVALEGDNKAVYSPPTADFLQWIVREFTDGRDPFADSLTTTLGTSAEADSDIRRGMLKKPCQMKPLPELDLSGEDLASCDFPVAPRKIIGVTLYRPSDRLLEQLNKATEFETLRECLEDKLTTRHDGAAQNGISGSVMWLSTPIRGKGHFMQAFRGQELVHNNCVLTCGRWLTSGHFEYGCSESCAVVYGSPKLWIIAGTKTAAIRLERSIRSANDLARVLLSGGDKQWFYCWATPGTTIAQPWWAAHTVLTSGFGGEMSFVGGWECTAADRVSSTEFCLSRCCYRLAHSAKQRKWQDLADNHTMKSLLAYSRTVDKSKQQALPQTMPHTTAIPDSEITQHLQVLVSSGVNLKDVVAFSRSRSISPAEEGRIKRARRRVDKHDASYKGGKTKAGVGSSSQ
jgi:hypothetical protein